MERDTYLQLDIIDVLPLPEDDVAGRVLDLQLQLGRQVAGGAVVELEGQLQLVVQQNWTSMDM